MIWLKPDCNPTNKDGVGGRNHVELDVVASATNFQIRQLTRFQLNNKMCKLKMG